MGTLSTFSAMCCFFWYLQEVGGLHADCIFFSWTYGSDNFYNCTYDSTVNIPLVQQGELIYTAQSIYFVSIVITQWFNMLTTRARYSSILDHNPFYGRAQNLWLFVAMAGGIGVCAFVLNVQWFNMIFFTRPVPVKYVCPAIGFGALMLIMDELRKWNIRKDPKGFLAQIAW